MSKWLYYTNRSYSGFNRLFWG